MTIEELYSLFLQSNGISTDTRKMVPGSIFFALKGDQFNANEFAANAIEAGCSFAVVDEKEVAVSDKYILVDSVLLTLQQLARHHRRQFTIPVIGITGSNGKTTTKELLGAVLSTTYNTLVTEGNLNNHLGVPFTLLRLNARHEMAIIEMGANKPGDIKELAEIAEPTHGIITNIGAAHIEGFGSLQGVINTKTEMYRFVAQTKGTLFINTEDTTLMNNLPANVPTIGYGQKAKGISGKITDLTPFVHFIWTEQTYPNEIYTSPVIKSNLVGSYNYFNFLAAICIGRFFDVKPDSINKALEEYVPSNKRSQIEKTQRNTLLVDCYNANATSMMAALQNFVDIDHPNKILILGDMLELGPISTEEHQRMTDFVTTHKLNAILVGTEFAKTTSNSPKYNSAQLLIDSGKLSKIENSMILLKGSRGIKLETVIPYL